MLRLLLLLLFNRRLRAVPYSPVQRQEKGLPPPLLTEAGGAGGAGHLYGPAHHACHSKRQLGSPSAKPACRRKTKSHLALAREVGQLLQKATEICTMAAIEFHRSCAYEESLPGSIVLCFSRPATTVALCLSL